MKLFESRGAALVLLHRLAMLLALMFVASTARSQSNGTVTISKKGATEITAEEKVVLTVKKGANEVDKTEGAHKFPKYTSLKSMAAYYGPILKQNGFTEGTDYTIAENSIHFYGVDKIDGGSTDGVDVEGTLDKGKFEPIKKVKLSMTRGASPLFGVVTITAAGLIPDVRSDDSDDGLALVPSSSQVTVYYKASDTAEALMAKIAEALTADGWNALADGSAVVIDSHRGGCPALSIHVRFQHLPRAGETKPTSIAEAADHWVLERVVD